MLEPMESPFREIAKIASLTLMRMTEIRTLTRHQGRLEKGAGTAHHEDRAEGWVDEGQPAERAAVACHGGSQPTTCCDERPSVPVPIARCRHDR